MTNQEWKQFIGDILDSVERELLPSTPVEDQTALQAFRARVRLKRVTEARKPFERELDGLIDGRSSLQAAAQRYLDKAVPRVLEDTVATLKKTLGPEAGP